MTAIQGYVKPSRRPGELGVHSLDHFHFSVPDLSVAQNFYGEFGLDLEAGANRIAMRTFGAAQVWGTIGEGPRKKLGYVSFGAFEDDLDRFAKRLQEMGVARLDPPPGVDFNGLWLHDHDGMPIEIKAAAKTSPDDKSTFNQPSVGPGQRGAPSRSGARRVHPRQSRARLDFHARRAQGHRLLHARPRNAVVGSFRRQHRVPARHPR